MQSKAYYIDKTESLAEGIRRFPSIYIEGNAAIGKSTAIELLLEKYPEAKACTLKMDEWQEKPDLLEAELCRIRQKLKEEHFFAVFENMPKALEEGMVKLLVNMVMDISGDSKVIFVSREKPRTEFLELLWKGKMELFTAEKFLLSANEVRELINSRQVSADAELLHQKTGGWAGCVDLLCRMWEKEKEIEELLDSYEIRGYIQHTILGALDTAEKQLLEHAVACPWVNEELCTRVWGTPQAEELLENLCRKGILIFEKEKRRWKTAPLFGRYVKCSETTDRESIWYEEQGYIAEAFLALKSSGSMELRRECVRRYYDRVYALGLLSEEALSWDRSAPEHCYLRGAYYHSIQDFEGLNREIKELQKISEKDHHVKEILLNLLYLHPAVTLTEWLKLAQTYGEKEKKFRIYHMLGNSCSYLCGVRDWTAMFACSKKEEAYYEKLWKNLFGETEWKCYQLARIDYYMETERQDAVCSEDWELLGRERDPQDTWQLRMAKLTIYCKRQRMQPEERNVERIHKLEQSIKAENHPVCGALADAVSSFYAPWYGERERMLTWLRRTVSDSSVLIGEDNYMQLFCQVKGYLLLNQYERAEKILKTLIPYLQNYGRQRLLAEAHFQYAVANYGRELQMQSIKNTIESFLISRNNRYVIFYAGYGQTGGQVLEAYLEWMNSNAPEGWSYKKKYNYGNVLRMPVEDYIGVILRCVKKALKSENNLSKERFSERLTMMENIVLQDIAMGMSNAEIAKELGLKLPTIKGHIYTLFKKLGVNSRMQAVLKGKELGILE